MFELIEKIRKILSYSMVKTCTLAIETRETIFELANVLKIVIFPSIAKSLILHNISTKHFNLSYMAFKVFLLVLVFFYYTKNIFLRVFMFALVRFMHCMSECHINPFQNSHSINFTFIGVGF